ncbi:MAG TPA: VOC family protein [Puia sp.]|nr:VOC family protein [Puia sp.]
MEFITFGPVHLNVTDLEKSVLFYRDILGMKVRKTDTPTEVGTSERTLVVLHPDAKIPNRKGHSGLYHFAIHIPTERELAQLFVRLSKKGWRAGPTDHIIAKSVYVKDPDGIDIELAVELPRRVVEYRFTEDEFKVIDDKGQLRSPIEPLDVQELLSHLDDDNTDHPFPEKAFVGHMNLHMPNLQNAYDFYKKIGFTEHFIFPKMGWGDLGAGGLVDHRIAVNTWAGVNAPKTPAGMAGLKYFTLKYDSKERLNKALNNISNEKEQDKENLIEDPAGNKIILVIKEN